MNKYLEKIAALDRSVGNLTSRVRQLGRAVINRHKNIRKGLSNKPLPLSSGERFDKLDRELSDKNLSNLRQKIIDKTGIDPDTL